MAKTGGPSRSASRLRRSRSFTQRTNRGSVRTSLSILGVSPVPDDERDHASAKRHSTPRMGRASRRSGFGRRRRPFLRKISGRFATLFVPSLQSDTHPARRSLARFFRSAQGSLLRCSLLPRAYRPAGTAAGRKPRSMSRTPGVLLLRYADRQSAARSPQPPPRVTRAEPSATPVGSDADPLA